MNEQELITRFRSASLDVKNAVIGALKGAVTEKESQSSGGGLNISGGNNASQAVTITKQRVSDSKEVHDGQLKRFR
ncbi:transcriptional regulator [Escherichia coli]|uniref:Transcriptional regulator n=1 Tax=Escherichia coli TaxID=562 RepID=A0A377D387_ECOLX|nr:transcriptional regulator [Escherichia coli]